MAAASAAPTVTAKDLTTSTKRTQSPPASRPSQSSPPSSDSEVPAPLERTSTRIKSSSSRRKDSKSDKMPSSSNSSKKPAREPSPSWIVPRDHPDGVELKHEVIRPNDPRSFSPRRSPAEIDKMVRNTRQETEAHAKDLQGSLSNLLARIELVEQNANRLNANNAALQQYMGAMTESIARSTHNLHTLNANVQPIQTAGRKK